MAETATAVDRVDVLITEFGAFDGWEPCLRSLRHAGHDLRINILVPESNQTEGVRVVAPDLAEVVAPTAVDGLAMVLEGSRDELDRHVVLICRPVVVPPGFLAPALAMLDDDLRVATVSLLTNDAGQLSFPHRNRPITHQVEDLDEVAITRRLRQRSPELRPVPVALAVGPLTLMAGPALAALGELPRRRRGEDLVGAISLAAQLKGFVSVVEPSTFYATPHDLGWRSHERSPATDPGEIELPSTRVDPPLELGQVGALVAQEETSETSPFAIAHAVARAKVLGLRIGIDGTCLGPRMMGTQVQTLAIIDALAKHDDVAEVTVALAGSMPSYARAALTHEKVRTFPSVGDDMADVASVDVLHRPFQPQYRLDFEAWRKKAHRVAVSLLDVIAYRNGAYHTSGESWLGYRDAIWSTAAAVDGVTVISADVKEQILMERLPIDAERIHVVELGTDHISGAELEHAPRELLERGFEADEFLVVLGASYAHKNRDLAIRTVRELRQRGREIGLVLVGAPVPHGSSRQFEARALADAPADWLWTIPDVTPEERNWLLAHAAAVLYPTSAEGFGFIPFEAAQFNTPTLCVPFGPLAELSPDLPLTAASWDPHDLGDAVERLLSDPAKARAQVEEIKAAGGRFTWHRTASKLVNFYRDMLASPAR